MSKKAEPSLHDTAPLSDAMLPLESLKRRSYAVSALLGVVSLLAVLQWEPSGSISHDFNHRVYPVMIGVLALLFVAVWLRKVALAWVEVGLIGTGASFILAKLFYIFYIEQSQVNTLPEIFSLMGWVPSIFIGFFLVLEWQRGLVAAFAFYVAMILVGLPYVLFQFQADNKGDFVSLLEFYLAMGSLVALFYTFSKIRDYYSRAQTRTETLEQLATRDFLTGLANRRLMHEVLANEVGRAQRHARPFAVILFDLDHFKVVNDMHGHEVGDYVLREVAALMAQGLRKSDRIGRWGGEEFLIVCEETPATEAAALAERLKHDLESLRLDYVGTITASFGVTEYGPGDTPQAMLKRADEALYQAKTRGRNRVDVLPAPAPEITPVTLYAGDLRTAPLIPSPTTIHQPL